MDVTRRTRAERLAMPLARDVVKDLAAEHGACIRPVQLRQTNLDTGTVDQVLVPCGHTLAVVCPACAQRAKTLRAAQCREGWHLETEPVIEPDPATEDQKWWVEKRAEAQAMHDQADKDGEDAEDLDALNAELDQEINKAGMRGNVLPARPVRRHRTTRRRQDAAPLPRRKVAARTVGKVYDDSRTARRFRPSMFLTLTCPSYGRVREDGTPGRPGRLRLHRAQPATRCTSRRCSTGSSRTFAASSAMTCSTSRRSSRNGDWPHMFTWPCAVPSPAPNCAGSWPRPITRSGGPTPPSCASRTTRCPCGMSTRPPTSTRPRAKSCPTWDDALDAIGDQDEPLHVARFGERFDAQGVLAGSKDAARCIGYLTKYLTKQVADCHQAQTDAQRAHIDRLAEALRLRAVLAAVRQLAPLRHPAQERPAGPDPRRMQGQGPPPRIPRLRRAPGAGLPQVVGQDAGRPPRRPQELAAVHARRPGHRPGPLRLGTGHP